MVKNNNLSTKIIFKDRIGKDKDIEAQKISGEIYLITIKDQYGSLQNEKIFILTGEASE